MCLTSTCSATSSSRRPSPAAWSSEAAGPSWRCRPCRVAWRASDQAAYCASKAAIRQALRCLALETAPRGVRINTVSPGATDTSMVRGVAGSLGQSTSRLADEQGAGALSSARARRADVRSRRGRQRRRLPALAGVGPCRAAGSGGRWRRVDGHVRSRSRRRSGGRQSMVTQYVALYGGTRSRATRRRGCRTWPSSLLGSTGATWIILVRAERLAGGHDGGPRCSVSRA